MVDQQDMCEKLCVVQEEVGSANIDTDYECSNLRFNMAVSCLWLGELANAEKLLTQSASTIEKRWGKQNFDYISRTKFLAYMYSLKGENTKAETLFQEAIQIFEKIADKNDPTLAGYYLDFANALFLT